MADLYFVDANVFLRLLVKEDEEVWQRCYAFFERAKKGEIKITTSVLVLAEIAGVLESYYGLTRQEIAEKLTSILNTPGFTMPQSDMIWKAVEHYLRHNVKFPDAYHALSTTQAGAKAIASFDKEFDSLPGVSRVEP